MTICAKHHYENLGRSYNRATNLFQCYKCQQVIAIPHAVVRGLVIGKGKRLRRRNIHLVRNWQR